MIPTFEVAAYLPIESISAFVPDIIHSFPPLVASIANNAFGTYIISRQQYGSRIHPDVLYKRVPEDPK
jgi:hypothetical protein